MANSKEYKVNSIGHWQGIEEVIEEVVAGEGNPIPDGGITGELENLGNTVSEKLDEVEQGLSIVISTESENIITELGKLQNGQTAAAQQLTELETLITQSNTLLSQILQALNDSVTSINDRLTALEARTNFPLQEETETTLALTPNVYHQWGEVASLNLTFQEGANPEIVDEYVFQFTSPAQNPTVLTLPESVRWIGDSEIQTGLTYVVTVVNNLAVLGGA